MKHRKSSVRRQYSRLKAGNAPGTFVYVGNHSEKRTVIDKFEYNSDLCNSKKDVSINECIADTGVHLVTWLNIEGLSDFEKLNSIAKAYDIHPLTLEDISNTTHRPKFEELRDNLFLVIKLLRVDESNQKILVEHFALILSSNSVLSFQESKGDSFDSIRKRILEGSGRVRHNGADYLFYLLIDSIVDSYFSVLDFIEERIDQLDDGLISGTVTTNLQDILTLKKDILLFRRIVVPLREIINAITKLGSDKITFNTEPFLADLQDHIIHCIESVDSARDRITNLSEYRLSLTNYETNQIVKILTIVASIFIPLTFIVGVYGMNFDNMPELHWPNGYYILWGIMMAIVMITAGLFKKLKWF